MLLTEERQEGRGLVPSTQATAADFLHPGMVKGTPSWRRSSQEHLPNAGPVREVYLVSHTQHRTAGRHPRSRNKTRAATFWNCKMFCSTKYTNDLRINTENGKEL